MNDREFILFLLKEIQDVILGDEPDFDLIEDTCREMDIDLDEVWTY